MTMTSASQLAATLAKVRAKIASLRDQGERVSEEDTKAILIDPVLAALGWRLDELEDVRREYRAKPADNPVDYALLIFGRPRLFVEAKALASVLDRKSAAQVLGYASVVGVGWCLLTNGDEYRLYNSHAKVDVDEKLLRCFSFSDPAQTELALETLGLVAREQMGDTELDLLWQSQFVDRRVKATLEALFSGESDALARLVRKHSADLTLGDVRASLRRAQLQVHFPVMAPPAVAASPSGSGALPDEGATKGKPPAHYAVALSDLIAAGLVQPPLALECTYKGVCLAATIAADGRVEFAGERYESLSTAAGMARKSVVGAPPGRPYPQTNGWVFWRCVDGTEGPLRPIDDLRQEYLQQHIASDE